MKIEQNKNFVQSSGGKTGLFKQLGAYAGYDGCMPYQAATDDIGVVFRRDEFLVARRNLFNCLHRTHLIPAIFYE